MHARKCSDDLCHLTLLIIRFQIRPVDITTSAQGDQHGFRPGTTRDGKSTVVQYDCMPDDIGTCGAEAIFLREVLRGIRPIDFEGLGKAREGGQQPEIMQRCGRKGGIGVKSRGQENRPRVRRRYD